MCKIEKVRSYPKINKKFSAFSNNERKDTYSPKNKKARCIWTFGNLLGGIYSSGRIHSKKIIYDNIFFFGKRESHYKMKILRIGDSHFFLDMENRQRSSRVEFGSG